MIAKSGYNAVVQTNFFPLYPLAIHVVNFFVSSELDSALIISWLCLFGAIYFYLKIAKSLFKITDNLEALRSLIFFVFFPTAVFLLATYTESMFAFLSLGAIYFALKNRYLAAGLFALFCSATHINGIFVVLLIGLILFEQKQSIQRVITSMLIGSIGLLSYMYYLAVHFSKPFAFISSQKSHGWFKGSYLDIFNSVDLFNIIFMLLLVVSVIYWWKRRKSFAIYSFLFICIPILGKQFGGFNRYVLMAFPLQFMLYEYLRNKKVAYSLATILLGITWAYFLFQYAGGYVGG